MAPIVQDGLEHVLHYPAFFLVCIFVLMIILILSCTDSPEEAPPKASARRERESSSPSKPASARREKDSSPPSNPALPTRSERPDFVSKNSDDSTTSERHYMNHAIPVANNSSESDVNTYMNAAAAGTLFQPLTFDTNAVIGPLMKSLKPHSINERRVELHDVIGKGAFGLVYKGTLRDRNFQNPIDVAVKTVHGTSCSEGDLKSFLEEVIRMCGFEHINVQSTLGISFRSGQPYAIMPFMDLGDVRAFILSTEKDLTIRFLLECGLQIANGMEYLASRRFVHRDLAARNCMIDSKMVIKVADFGLSRDIFNSDYYRMHKTSTTPLPVRWMAPESLAEKVYTTKTDVWSFGIVLWELLTRGRTPYPKLPSLQVIDHVKKGGRLEKPPGCPPDMYNMMSCCWDDDMTKRPDFPIIVKKLRRILKK